MSHDNPTKKIKVSFLGGVEETVGCRQMDLTINRDIRKITQFIKYMHDEVLKENPKREELLLDDKTVKPGILLLHNNRDINLFEQAEEDEADESDTDDNFRFNEVFGGQPAIGSRPAQPPKKKEEKLRISENDEITFLSIIHGG